LIDNSLKNAQDGFDNDHNHNHSDAKNEYNSQEHGGSAALMITIMASIKKIITFGIP
jgi:hypothetical protein